MNKPEAPLAHRRLRRRRLSLGSLGGPLAADHCPLPGGAGGSCHGGESPPWRKGGGRGQGGCSLWPGWARGRVGSGGGGGGVGWTFAPEEAGAFSGGEGVGGVP